MSKDAHLPDGTVLQFPDETPDDVMDKAVRTHLATDPNYKAQASNTAGYTGPINYKQALPPAQSAGWTGAKELSNQWTANILNPVGAAGNAIIPGMASFDNTVNGNNAQQSMWGKPGSFLDAYHSNLQALKAQDHSNEIANPGISTTASLAGAVLSPFNKIAAPVEGAGLAVNAGRLFAGGATYGAVNGAATSNADSLGGVARDSLVQSGAGGLGALVVGGAATGIARGAGHVFDAGARLAGSDPNLGAGLVAKALQGDNLTPTDATTAMTTAQANGTPATLADLGENARALAGSVSRQQGAARNTATTAVDERQFGQADRVKGMISRDLGPTTDTFAESNRLMQQAKDNAAPLYDKFRAEAPVSSPVIDRLLATPAGKKALNHAYEIAANEERDPTALGFVKDDAGNVTMKPPVASNTVLDASGKPMMGQSAGPVTQTTYTPETLDYVKRGLDTVIEKQPRDPASGKVIMDDATRSIDGARRRFVNEADNLYPDTYPQARAAYGGPAKLNSAMLDGKAALNKPANDINQRLLNMTEPERQQYALGLRSAISDTLDKSPDGANIVRKVIGTRGKRDVLARVFGDSGQVDRLVESLGNEQAAHATYQAVRGGSPTANRMSEDAQNNDLGIVKGAGQLLGAASGGKAGILRYGLDKATNALQFGAGEAGNRAREDAASLLFSSNPSDFQNAIVTATRANQQASNRVNALNLGSDKLAGRVGTQAGIGVQKILSANPRIGLQNALLGKPAQ